MVFIKVVKNKAYFKRFQVKFRRRREGKTDYQARLNLIVQDKNKYNSPKYRLVVRFTNTDVICQIIYSKIAGDVVMTAAYSHELPRYGLSVGLTNFAATYATGLLLARRHLKKLKLDTKYVGKTEVDGEDFNVEPNEDGPRPFLAILDIGLARTTTGSRLFAALKGALDGGLNIPHGEKRFFGYDKEESKLDAKKLRKVIFGGHVSEYMKSLSQAHPDRYKRQFSRYIKAGITPDKVEGIIKNTHKAIRADPTFKSKAEIAKAAKPAEAGKAAKPAKSSKANNKQFRKKKLTLAQRKTRINQKLKKKAEAAASSS